MLTATKIVFFYNFVILERTEWSHDMYAEPRWIKNVNLSQNLDV